MQLDLFCAIILIEPTKVYEYKGNKNKERMREINKMAPLWCTPPSCVAHKVKRYLTDKERMVYDYIVECLQRDGYAPSVRDILFDLDFRSTSTVHKCLNNLAEKGYLQKERGKSRTLRTDEASNTPRSRATVKVPLLGRVAAGTPLLAVENHEGSLDYPVTDRSMLDSELFGLRVSGDSMVEAGILDGDVIIIRKDNTAKNGDIVVALVDEEATVKTFYKENGHFRLQPENSSMEPILLEDVFIIGKVISLMRSY